MIEDKTQKLAERIALLLQDSERETDDFSALRLSIEKINERLDKIESKLESDRNDPPPAFRLSPFVHPSSQRFENLEDSSHRGIAAMQNEKACPYEPAGKPCDHCAMCSARGF